MVPSTVTTSGLTPARTSARASGVKSRVNSARAKRLITRVTLAALCGPWPWVEGGPMGNEKNTGAAGRAAAAQGPTDVRNVVLIGPSGAGKTSLVEALLVATGTINRPGRVEDGTTVSDFDEAEQ